MESTLECFYLDHCLSEIFNLTYIKPLNNSIYSNFPIDTKIQILVEELFIENWTNEYNFESFFQECQTIKCTYSYNARRNVVFVITIIFSLIGGLFVALKIVAIVIVNIYRKLEEKCKKKSSSSIENDQGKIEFED